MDNKNSGFNMWNANRAAAQPKRSPLSGFLWWTVIFIACWWAIGAIMGPRQTVDVADTSVTESDLSAVPVSNFSSDLISISVQGLRISDINLSEYQLTPDGTENVVLFGGDGNYIESVLAAYKPQVLKNDSHDNMARFFGRILSPISKPQPKTCNNNISNLVTVDDVEFLRDGIVRYISGDEQSFSACLSFKISPDYLDEEFFNSVSTIQTEMITLNAFHIMGAGDVEKTIKQRRTTADTSVDSTEEQISQAESTQLLIYTTKKLLQKMSTVLLWIIIIISIII